jgi:GNAT superfamily N-acetyltransferase
MSANFHIRPFQDTDAHRLVDILSANDPYGYPEVEGPEAMKRVAAREAAVFLVGKVEGHICGCIKAVYDGSRALIHLLSVDPDYHRQGIGQTLVNVTWKELKRRGAPTIAGMVNEQSST